MANLNFKVNVLPKTNLGYSLGSTTALWNIYGNLTGSATLSGTPTAPTAATDTNNTLIATTAFVNNFIKSLTTTLWKGVAESNINIPANGGEGIIGHIDISKGTWIIYTGGWCPSLNGYVSCNGMSMGWGRDGHDCYTWFLSSPIGTDSNTRVNVKYVNWATTACTSAGGGFYIFALRLYT